LSLNPNCITSVDLCFLAQTVPQETRSLDLFSTFKETSFLLSIHPGYVVPVVAIFISRSISKEVRDRKEIIQDANFGYTEALYSTGPLCLEW
jgi:hypothetical protein